MAKLVPPYIIGVTRPRTARNVGIVLRSCIEVAHQHRNRRTQRRACVDTAKHFRGIGFRACRSQTFPVAVLFPGRRR